MKRKSLPLILSLFCLCMYGQNNFSLLLNPHVYTQVPQSQATVALQGVTVTNEGQAVEAGAGSLKITIVETSYEETILLPELSAGESVELKPSTIFKPASTGSYTATYTLDFEGGNDTKSATFEVSEKTFATDKVKSTSDINPNMGQGYFPGNYGNAYEITSEVTIESFSIVFLHGNGNFSLGIYKLESEELTTVYESEEMGKKIPEEGWGSFVEYEIEPQTLTPGKYLFTVINKGNGLAYDTNTAGVFHYPDFSYDQFGTVTGKGALCVRINVNEVIKSQLNEISHLRIEQNCTTVNLAWEVPRPVLPEGVIFFEGFNNSIPSIWINIDSDGDKYKWYFQNYDPLNGLIAYEGNGYAVSDSWVAGKDPLDPDNWLISPPIELTSENILSYAVSAQEAAEPYEHYGVFISTTDNELSSFTELYHETLQAMPPLKSQGTWYERTIDLKDYAGKTVYIAFRHYDSESQFRLNLDAVKIKEKDSEELPSDLPFYYPTSYEVYRNGELIGIMDPGNTYTDLEVPPGEMEYCIVAVYGEGKSKPHCGAINITNIEPANEINENFDNGLPFCWSLQRTYATIEGKNAYWLFSDRFRSYYEWEKYTYPESMDETFAFFDASGQDKGGIGAVVTSKFIPSESLHRLLFDVEERLENPIRINTGIELYSEVSTDNGLTWTTSTENILARMNDHNLQTCFATMEMDLSSYIGQTIKVRLRAVADHGAFVLFLDNVRLGNEISAPEIILLAKEQKLKQVPLVHAEVDLAGALIKNTGSPLQNGETNVEISVTPGDFKETKELPAITTYGSTTINPIAFKAEETGIHTITYKANIKNKPELSIMDTETFEVTESVFAIDNGKINGGIGLEESPSVVSMGNVFTFLVEDVVKSFSVAFNNISNQSFSLSIFKVTNGNSLTEIYTSDIQFKAPGASWGIMQEYEIEPQQLEAGTYFFAVNQTNERNVALGVDSSKNGLLYMTISDNGSVLETYTNYGTPMVRVNTSGKGWSIEENRNAENGIKVYPTYTSGTVYIKTHAESTVKVVDIWGKVLSTYKSDGDITIEMDYPDGIYLIVNELNGKIYTNKVVLKK